jgi:hypothetical protein
MYVYVCVVCVYIKQSYVNVMVTSTGSCSYWAPGHYLVEGMDVDVKQLMSIRTDDIPE